MKQVKVLQLINAIVSVHQHANLDPLTVETRTRGVIRSFFPHSDRYDFRENLHVGSFASGKETMKLGELLDALKQTYCGPIGAGKQAHTSTEEKR